MKLYFKRLNGAVEQERFAINLLTLYSSTLKKQKKTKPKEKQKKKTLLFTLFYVVQGQQLWNIKML